MQALKARSALGSSTISTRLKDSLIREIKGTSIHQLSPVYNTFKLIYFIFVFAVLDAATLTEVFPCFFLGCKANARVILAKTGHGPHSSKIVVLLYVLFVLYRSMYCLCVNVYCTTATG